MSELVVPGYDVVELLGYGSGGEVWLGRERATGLPVALKRVPAGADLTARDRLRREAAVLVGVQHPHVVRLRGVHGVDDALVLVLDLAPGGSLARLLATRGTLSPGEVVTLGVPLAQALAAVHAQGLVHGDVTPANVLFAADGRPLLGDLGVAGLTGLPPGEVGGTSGFVDPAVLAGAAPGPPSDVHGLAATCLTALTGRPPYDGQGRRVPLTDAPTMVAALEPALAADPVARPTAERLAVALFEAAVAEPVRLDRSTGPLISHRPAAQPLSPPTYRVAPASAPVTAADPPRRHGRARVPSRTVLRAAVAAAAVGLATVTGIAWADAGGAPRAGAPRAADVSGRPEVGAQRVPTASKPPSVEGWAATLAALDRARSQAFASGDPMRLTSVYAPGAPALRRDQAVLRRLTRAGLRAAGLRLRVTAVTAASPADGRVRLAVTDVMPPYRLVDDGGTVVEARPGRRERSWTVVLARSAGRWRVYDVVRG